MTPSIWASLLTALASFAPTLAAWLGHEPVPPPPPEKRPGFDAIDKAEDAEIRRRKGGER